MHREEYTQTEKHREKILKLKTQTTAAIVHQKLMNDFERKKREPKPNMNVKTKRKQAKWRVRSAHCTFHYMHAHKHTHMLIGYYYCLWVCFFLSLSFYFSLFLYRLYKFFFFLIRMWLSCVEHKAFFFQTYQKKQRLMKPIVWLTA